MELFWAYCFLESFCVFNLLFSIWLCKACLFYAFYFIFHFTSFMKVSIMLIICKLLAGMVNIANIVISTFFFLLRQLEILETDVLLHCYKVVLGFG